MDDRYKETFETWNKVASLYQDKFMYLNLYNESYDSLCSLLSVQNAKILELGCGPGNITRYLFAKRPDFHIQGIDISPNMIQLAKANNPTASFQVMDIRKIDQIESKFDGIVCGFCLPYLSEKDCQKLILDSYFLLNNDGLLYISFVEDSKANSGFKSASSGDRTYFYYHGVENLKLLLSQNSFDLVRILKVNYEKADKEKEIHSIVIAKKKSH